MKYTRFPQTHLSVSVIALGTWVFDPESWGNADENQSIDAVKAAIELGINFIDTAPVYGNGRSEIIVGKAIKGKRQDVVLATKCGLTKKGKDIFVDLRPESIFREIDVSLKRLQTDYIDLYQCHWPDPNVPIEKTLAALKKIKEAGKIRYIGVSNFDAGLLAQASDFYPVTSLQSQYSLLERSIEKDVLPLCRQRQIGVITYGTLAGGILSGKYMAEKHFPDADARNFFYRYYTGTPFQATQKLLAQLKDIHRPLNQIAINWVRQQPGITSVIAGCRNRAQVQGNAASADWDLSTEELKSIG